MFEDFEGTIIDCPAGAGAGACVSAAVGNCTGDDKGSGSGANGSSRWPPLVDGGDEQAVT